MCEGWHSVFIVQVEKIVYEFGAFFGRFETRPMAEPLCALLHLKKNRANKFRIHFQSSVFQKSKASAVSTLATHKHHNHYLTRPAECKSKYRLTILLSLGIFVSNISTYIFIRHWHSMILQAVMNQKCSYLQTTLCSPCISI